MTVTDYKKINQDQYIIERMPMIIESFVKFYGEEYRAYITKCLSEVNFVFLCDPSTTIELKYLSDINLLIIQKLKQSGCYILGKDPNILHNAIINIPNQLKHKEKNLEFIGIYVELLHSGRKDIQTDKAGNSIFLWENKIKLEELYRQYMSAWDATSKAEYKQLLKLKDQTKKKKTNKDRIASKLQETKIKKIQNNLIERFPDKRENVLQLNKELLDIFSHYMYTKSKNVTDRQSFAIMKIIEGLGFKIKNSSEIEHYPNVKALINLNSIENEKLRKSLFKIQQLSDIATGVATIPNFSQYLTIFDNDYNKILFIKSAFDGNGLAVSTIGKMNAQSYTNVCAIKSIFSTSASTIFHELNHTISNRYLIANHEIVGGKLGIETSYTRKYKSNTVAFNEVLTEYFANEILKNYNKIGPKFFLTYGVKPCYYLGQILLSPILAKYQSEFKKCYISQNDKDIVNYLGEENFVKIINLCALANNATISQYGQGNGVVVNIGDEINKLCHYSPTYEKCLELAKRTDLVCDVQVKKFLSLFLEAEKLKANLDLRFFLTKNKGNTVNVESDDDEPKPLRAPFKTFKCPPQSSNEK